MVVEQYSGYWLPWQPQFATFQCGVWKSMFCAVRNNQKTKILPTGFQNISSYLTLGRTYMFPVNQHLSYIKIIYSIIIINNDHINILIYIMPYRIHS